MWQRELGLGGGTVLGGPGWFYSRLSDAAKPPVTEVCSPFYPQGYFGPRRLIIQLY